VFNLLVSTSKCIIETAMSYSEDLPIPMLTFTFGNLNMGKYISQIFLNLAAKHSNGSTEV